MSKVLVLWTFLSAVAVEDVAMLQRSCTRGCKEQLVSSRAFVSEVSPLSELDLVQVMRRVKEECRASTPDCLPALTEARHRVWPYVQAESLAFAK